MFRAIGSVIDGLARKDPPALIHARSLRSIASLVRKLASSCELWQSTRIDRLLFTSEPIRTDLLFHLEPLFPRHFKIIQHFHAR